MRSAELTNAQLKQIKADQKITEESLHAVKLSGEQLSKKHDQDTPIPLVNCKYCGKKHPRDKNLCPAYGAKCQKCGKPNHFAAKCKSKTYRPRVNYIEEDEANSDDDYTIGTVTHHIGALNAKPSKGNMIPKQLFASMKVNDKVNIKFQLDCGATCNILPLKQYVQAMGNPEDIYLQRINATLTMYNGTVMHPVGKCKVTCTRGNSKHLLEFQVVDCDVKPLLSAETCQKLKFLQVLVNDKHDKEAMAPEKMSVNATSDIFQEYADVFEGIGCLDESYHIEIDPSVKPVIHPPRRVPVTLKDPLKKELNRMVEEGILAPVKDPTDWVSSMVTVVKPDKLRICIDPKDLNRAIKRSHYPMPTIEEVATKLSNAKVFSVLDARSGFWQIKLDEETSILTTFNTPFGRFRWLRMPFGICSAPEEFQRRMNNTFENLKGTALPQEGHPVAFTSRALTATERNYAQIEKELLSIVHACDRFDQYVFGREITVETDHKPLEVILRKPLFAAPKRLQRMMMQLQKYNLKVIYKRGSEMYIADTLSRAYLSAPNQISVEEQEFIRAVENVKMTKYLSISPERLQEIQEKTREDATLQDLKKSVENGWPRETKYHHE